MQQRRPPGCGEGGTWLEGGTVLSAVLPPSLSQQVRHVQREPSPRVRGGMTEARARAGHEPGAAPTSLSLSPQLPRKRGRKRRVVDSSEDDEGSSADDFQ